MEHSREAVDGQEAGGPHLARCVHVDFDVIACAVNGAAVGTDVTGEPMRRSLRGDPNATNADGAGRTR